MEICDLYLRRAIIIYIRDAIIIDDSYLNYNNITLTKPLVGYSHNNIIKEYK